MSAATLAFPVLSCIMIEAIYVGYAPSPSFVSGFCEITSENQPLYQDVRFSSDDGNMLSGWYTPPRNGAVVILLHGYREDRREMEERAGALAEQDFGILLYYLCGHERSEGAFRMLGQLDIPDPHAALNSLQQQEQAVPPRISVFSLSSGGQITIGERRSGYPHPRTLSGRSQKCQSGGFTETPFLGGRHLLLVDLDGYALIFFVHRHPHYTKRVQPASLPRHASTEVYSLRKR